MAGRQPWRKLEHHRVIHGTGSRCSDSRGEKYHHRDRKREYVGVLAVIAALGSPAYANTTVANPSSTSTGSVVNNAYQMMTGPHPIYRMSQGIQCPGPTLTVSPFVTGSRNFDLPFESTTRTPVYSTADADDNGEPDAPGKVLYYSELPRFEKDRRSLNYGITATFSVPLDRGLADQCKRAVNTNIKLQEQLLATKRLEHELFRAAKCGELAKAGVQFTGQMSVVCSDLIVTVPPVKMVPHTHAISAPSAAPASSGK